MKCFKIPVVIVLLHLALSLSAPVNDTELFSGNDSDQDRNYIKQNGPESKTGLQEQELCGLSVKDRDTLEVMEEARCGVPDTRRVDTRWPYTHVTYRIVNYTPDLTEQEVDDTIARAFNLWSDVSALTLVKLIEGDADIMISFGNCDHGDKYPFKGPGGVLAHAFYPGTSSLNGDTHFDEDETWTLTKDRYNLFLVAVHEFGHSLGLSHSNSSSSIMNAYYHYVDTDGYSLQEEDAKRIQDLYGKREN
ncbi:collagenase 3-like [Amblyraja radiata]|uniref:collagenase 3-like n=1 Tax=Amblyraja radiata TaxID=386614 RepID=UPI001403D8C3|nr:collagenase 3-like [Amblyraja radiata]